MKNFVECSLIVLRILFEQMWKSFRDNCDILIALVYENFYITMIITVNWFGEKLGCYNLELLFWIRRYNLNFIKTWLKYEKKEKFKVKNKQIIEVKKEQSQDTKNKFQMISYKKWGMFEKAW